MRTLDVAHEPLENVHIAMNTNVDIVMGLRPPAQFRFCIQSRYLWQTSMHAEDVREVSFEVAHLGQQEAF